MRTVLPAAALFLAYTSASLANPSVESVWKYLATEEYASQWAVISVPGNKGYFQCERYEAYLRCPFPVWAKLLPDAQLYAAVTARSTPFPDLEGTETKTYLTESQAKELVDILRREELEFAEVYGRLEDQNGDPAGTNHDVVLVLELDYPDFTRLVETVLTRVWDANVDGGYEIETDSN